MSDYTVADVLNKMVEIENGTLDDWEWWYALREYLEGIHNEVKE